MVPIYFPPDRPSDAILEAEAKILETDGVYHVGELYFAKQADASIARRVEAERRVLEAARARRCAWCRQLIADGETFMEIAGRRLHDPKCTREFDDWAYGDNESAARPLKVVERVGALPDDTPVIWEGSGTTWGTLAQNERMCCERNAAGVLEGGYGI